MPIDNLSSKSSKILKISHTLGSMPNEVHLVGLHISKEYSQFQKLTVLLESHTHGRTKCKDVAHLDILSVVMLE